MDLESLLLVAEQHELCISISFPFPSSPKGAMKKGPGGFCTHGGSVSQLKDAELRQPQPYIGAAGKPAYSVLWREILYLLS